MKTLVTHPDLVRAWLLAQAGMPLPALPPLPPARPGLPPPDKPVHH